MSAASAEIPYQVFASAEPPGGPGDSVAAPVLFTHANGYPPDCYSPLLEQLAKRHRVLAMHLRPLWPGEQPQTVQDWRILSADVLEFLRQRACAPVIGVGHSVGAITLLRAALSRPDQFSALVLIEPVLLPPWVILLWQLISAFRLAKQAHPLTKSAQRRRQVFASRDEIFRGYRRKSIFRYLDDTSLRAYTNGLLLDLPDGRMGLRYSVDWEVQIYATGVKADLDLWFGLPKLRIPLLIIRGAETDTTWASTARLAQMIRPATRVITLQKATHLAPLEKPQPIAELIEKFLGEVGLTPQEQRQ